MKAARLAARMVLIVLVLTAPGWAATEITSITATPNPFSPIDGETTAITVQGTAGLTSLQAVILSADHATVIRSSLPLTEAGAGVYTATWDARDDSGYVVMADDYTIRVYNSATLTYMGPVVGISVINGLLPPSPNPFTPTGGNAVTITVQAAPGQTGLSVAFYSNWYGYWYGENGNHLLPLIETTPGAYAASWDALD
jgi:hypothetical protein